jgi:hypothetical protein
MITPRDKAGEAAARGNTPWVLHTDRNPGCAHCSKEGLLADEIEDASGKVIFHNGHETYFTPEFDLPTVVSAANERDSLLERVRVLEGALRPIVSCYGLGQPAEKFTEQVGPLILDARAALAAKGE